MDNESLMFREPTPEGGEMGGKTGTSTTVACRFCGFAVSHILLSLLTVISVFPLLMMSNFSPWGAALCGWALMAAYFPAGCLASSIEGWASLKSDREKALVVFLPALVAWAWVGIVFLALFGEEQTLMYVVFVNSLFLAAPSSFFSVLSMIFLGGPYGAGWGGLLVGGILSGFLPPFLFALGSFWQSARRERKALSIREGGAGAVTVWIGAEGQQGQIVPQEHKEGGEEL